MSMLATVTASSAFAGTVAQAYPTDPIFAAIEHHRAVNAAFAALLRRKDAWEELHGRWGNCDDPSGRDEWGRLEDESGTAESEAAEALVDTVPTTAAGAVAVLVYVRDLYARGDLFLGSEMMESLIANVANGLERLAIS